MDFRDISFERSFASAQQLPPSDLPEVSFAGRSNVGKSSLINALFSRKNLAKTSSAPGKTSTVNFFSVREKGETIFRVVDLPGYGYAKVSKQDQKRWTQLIEAYYNDNRRFTLVLALIDIRHEASTLDEFLLSFLKEAELDYAIVFTKADKLSKQAQLKQEKMLRAQLQVDKNHPGIICSSLKGTGIAALRDLIEHELSSDKHTYPASVPS